MEKIRDWNFFFPIELSIILSIAMQKFYLSFGTGDGFECILVSKTATRRILLLNLMGTPNSNNDRN